MQGKGEAEEAGEEFGFACYKSQKLNPLTPELSHSEAEK